MKLNNITYEIEDENTFYLVIDKPYLPYLIYLKVNGNNEVLNLNFASESIYNLQSGTTLTVDGVSFTSNLDNGIITLICSNTITSIEIIGITGFKYDGEISIEL